MRFPIKIFSEFRKRDNSGSNGVSSAEDINNRIFCNGPVSGDVSSRGNAAFRQIRKLRTWTGPHHKKKRIVVDGDVLQPRTIFNSKASISKLCLREKDFWLSRGSRGVFQQKLDWNPEKENETFDFYEKWEKSTFTEKAWNGIKWHGNFITSIQCWDITA